MQHLFFKKLWLMYFVIGIPTNCIIYNKRMSRTRRNNQMSSVWVWYCVFVIYADFMRKLFLPIAWTALLINGNDAATIDLGILGERIISSKNYENHHIKYCYSLINLRKDEQIEEQTQKNWSEEIKAKKDEKWKVHLSCIKIISYNYLIWIRIKSAWRWKLLHRY